METFVRSVLTTETGDGFLQQGLESELVQLGLNVCVSCVSSLAGKNISNRTRYIVVVVMMIDDGG